MGIIALFLKPLLLSSINWHLNFPTFSNYMNMLEQFEYSAYTNMLIIDRIFVSLKRGNKIRAKWELNRKIVLINYYLCKQLKTIHQYILSWYIYFYRSKYTMICLIGRCPILPSSWFNVCHKFQALKRISTQINNYRKRSVNLLW